jgi:hypothetical protein
MEFSDETLMAYADGELDEPTRRAVEAAMHSDPAISERIAQHRALRSQLNAAFDGVLTEPIPERLQAAAAATPAPTPVADLAAARAARREPPVRRSAWKAWTAIAASVLLALFVGRTVLQSPDSEYVAARGQQLFARGALAEQLSTQLSGGRLPDGRVAIVATFRARTNEYCRAFNTSAPPSLSGVACKADGGWRIDMLTQGSDAESGEYRQASSALPAIVAQTVESMMSGEALDGEEEAAAQARGWRDQ